MNRNEHSEHRRPFRIPFWLGVCLFAAIAVFFLWEEHQAHILGALPWLILLACPFIHIFMHRDHGHAHGHRHDDTDRRAARPSDGERGAP